MKVTPGHIKNKWLDLEYQDVEVDGRHLRYVKTGLASTKRVASLLVKEPITIAWMNTFAEGETLYDIGANVGMYTVYAAIMRKARVYAFEPEALNYAELNKNIFLNDLYDQVLSYCVALSDVDKTDRLLLSSFGYGISHHDFEENSWAGDMHFAPDWSVKKNERRPQGAIGRRLDTLVTEGLPVPTHIKIDVDGLEHRVVGGMLETLRRPEVRTALIEVNFYEPKNLELIDRICDLGWRYSWNQLRCNRKVIFTVEQIQRYQRLGKGGLNYIFYRDPFYDRFFEEFLEKYEPPLAGLKKRSVAQESASSVYGAGVDYDVDEGSLLAEQQDEPPPAEMVEEVPTADSTTPKSPPSPQRQGAGQAPAVPSGRTSDGEEILWLRAVSELKQLGGEDRWLASQGPVRFELTCSAAFFPKGWVLIRSSVSPAILDGSAMLLAVTDADETVFEIPVSAGGYIFELLKLPPQVRKLVWQPSQRSGTFEHTPVLMRSVSSLERYWMMARRVTAYSLKQPPAERKRVGLSLWRACFDLAGQYRACGRLRSYSGSQSRSRDGV